MRIGVVGAGRMGRPIAEHLAAAGHEIRVHDLRTEATQGFATAAPAELARWGDAVLTVLPGTSELTAVSTELGEPTGLWIDLTSADPRRVAELDTGPRFVGAPMAGGPRDAASGALRLFAAGPGDALESARAVLAPLGELVAIGPDATSGYLVKLLANLLWFGQSIAAAEALLIGRAAGLDPVLLRRLLADSAGSSAYLERWAPRLLGGDYLPDFGLDRVVEELDAITGLAAQSGIPTEVAHAVARLHREALERFGPADGELLGTALLEERAGLRLASIERPGAASRADRPDAPPHERSGDTG